MANIFLDRQPILDPMLAGSEPTGRTPETSVIGCSQDLAIMISSDDESEPGDFDDGRSDSFPSIDELLRRPASRNAERSSAVTVDNDAVLDCDNSGAREQPVTDSGGPADESATESTGDLESSTRVTPARPRRLTTPGFLPAQQGQSVLANTPPVAGQSPDPAECMEMSCQQGHGCPRHPTLSATYGHIQRHADGDAELSKAESPVGSLPGGFSGKPVSPRRAIRRRRHRDTDGEEDYHLTEDSDAEHSQDDVARPPRRKRRKIIPLLRKTPPKAPTRWQIPSHRVQTSAPDQKPTGRPRAPTPSPQRLSGAAQIAHTTAAKFEEWPLDDAVLKRVSVNGRATFQLEFTWVPCNAVHEDHTNSQAMGSPGLGFSARGRIRTERGTGMGVVSAPGEESPSPQMDHDVRSSALAKWEVEEILGARKRGRGRQVLVKWVGFADPTWEPLRNLLNTEALNNYEEKHGKVTP